ncbi:MAG: hypothetical protein WCC04_21740 [Terriglobales bacterium]
MTPRQAARLAEFDKKIAELCADPVMRINEMAIRLLVHESTIQRSFRRQNINRKEGRRPKVS